MNFERLEAITWAFNRKGIPHGHRNPAGFICGDIPSATTTQIIRLTERSSPASAVIAESWGALKRKFSEQSNSLN